MINLRKFNGAFEWKNGICYKIRIVEPDFYFYYGGWVLVMSAEFRGSKKVFAKTSFTSQEVDAKRFMETTIYLQRYLSRELAS